MSDANTLDMHGQTWVEALESFVEFYNGSVQRANGKAVGSLDIVHGYGSTGEGGVLKSRLRGFLQRHGNCLEFQLGEDVDGNQGHTIIMPQKMLPDTHELLAEKVWVYCASPKSISKITGKFRWHGDRDVLAAVQMLGTQHRLEVEYKRTLKQYRAV